MRVIYLLFLTLVIFNCSPKTILQGRTTTNLSLEDNYLPFQTEILDLDDTLRFDLPDCGVTAEVCIGIPLDSISDYQITTNGLPYTNGIAGCDYDTTNLYSYANLFGQGNLGPYILQSWNVNGSIFSSPFNSINELVDSMNVWDPTGNWVHDSGNLLISGGTPGYTYSDMVVWVITINTANTISHNDDFIPQGTMIFINSGATELIVTESSNGNTDTAFIIASCIDPDSFDDMVLIGESDTFCLDLSELPGNFINAFNDCTSTDVDFQLINGNTCVEYTGVGFGNETACIIACDDLGYCDTTFLNINSLPVTGSNELFDTVYVGEGNQWCADQTIFIGTVDTIYNICQANSGTFSSFTIDETNFCVDYTGLQYGGTEQGCFVVCDDLNNCDTTTINLTVLRSGPAFYADTLYINQLGNFCDWDVENLFGPIVDIQNGCPGSSGPDAIIDVDMTNFCIDYEAIGVGKDTACIYLTDSFGNVDTTIATICVLLPEAESIEDIIRLSNNPVYCMDTTQLAGNIISIENICPDNSGTEVEFVIDSATFCIQANPITLGTDTACIVLCDDFGVCDTTTIIVTVEEDPDMGPPIASDDNASTDVNTSVIIEACVNDILPAGLDITNFFVLPVASGGVGPNNGTAFPNSDCTISYVPIEDFCGEDQISYVICNMMGCDTATVTVDVICPSAEFQIFNAFSPNGDGVNEYFRINGADQFPNHTLTVYNRWGNEVLEVTDYQNDWNGTWNGLELPDGTYFYVFDTGNSETSKTGYVYIGR